MNRRTLGRRALDRLPSPAVDSPNSAPASGSPCPSPRSASPPVRLPFADLDRLLLAGDVDAQAGVEVEVGVGDEDEREERDEVPAPVVVDQLERVARAMSRTSPSPSG